MRLINSYTVKGNVNTVTVDSRAVRFTKKIFARYRLFYLLEIEPGGFRAICC